jgi:hypothetical protein
MPVVTAWLTARLGYLPNQLDEAGHRHGSP